VPVTVTATKTVGVATVTCAIGGAKLRFNPSDGNVVKGASDADVNGNAAPSGSATVTLLLGGGPAATYTGQATVSVKTMDGVTGNPTNYICFATTGTSDAYTTAPVISGTLPVVVK
jgi:hypothetical protein